MARKKASTTAYGLRVGHPQPWRQTVVIGDERVQLVFEPDQPMDLSENELEQLQPFVDSGLLVPWDADPKGRRTMRPRSQPAKLSQPEGPSERAGASEDIPLGDEDLSADE